MKPSLFQSRKFWIMVVDVFLSTIIYFVGQYVSPQIGENVLWLIGAWQPVIFAVVTGITAEDSAYMTAQSSYGIPPGRTGYDTPPEKAG